MDVLDDLAVEGALHPLRVGLDEAFATFCEPVASAPVAGQAVQQEQQGASFRAAGQGLEGHASCLDLDVLQ
jgi:hypothetical protein